MFCNKCGATIPDTSAFCNKCGASQSGDAAAPSTGSGQAPAPSPVAPPPAGKDDPEEIVWEGRYSAKAAGHWWLLWFLWVAALAYVYVFVLKAEHRGAIVNYSMLALTALPALVILWNTLIRKLTIRYKLTSYRFFRQRGIIQRALDELELMRVDDVSVSQNILQRIFNVGVVTIISSDSTDPRLEVAGIGDPIEVKEKIRTYVQRRRQRVVKMDQI